MYVTCDRWLLKSISYLKLYNYTVFYSDLELLLKYVLNISSEELIIYSNNILSSFDLIRLEWLLFYYRCNIPIAYLVGEQEFWSLSIKIDYNVFIPRSDTECLVEQVLKLSSDCYKLNVLDLGTGSGSIALAIASERPNWFIIGIDKYYYAIVLARKNSDILGIHNVRFFCQDWTDGFGYGSYDIICSNPPYIDIEEIDLQKNNLLFEPRSALFSKNNGLFDLFVIIRSSVYYLNYGGWLLVEHGKNQGRVIRKMFRRMGFFCVSTIKDYSNHARITIGKKDF